MNPAFDIHPRPTGDGYNLSGGMLGGVAGSHWFRSVRDAATYARTRCQQVGGGVVRVYHANGTLRAERTVEGIGGGPMPGPTPGQPAGRWF